MAGETLDQALGVTRKLNGEEITVTLDHLGESVNSLDEAAEARDVYLRTIDAVQQGGVQGNVSPAASRICARTRSTPHTCSVTGCSTWSLVLVSRK